jgi:signal transduction histidine kinase/DNA-binding response OmpR family regulator
MLFSNCSFGYTLGQLKDLLREGKPLDTVNIDIYFRQLISEENPQIQADAYLELGKYLETTHNYDSAEAAYKSAISFYLKAGDESGLAKSKLQLADYYRNEDRAALAIKLSHEALTLFEKLQDSVNIYYSLSSIAINHDYLGDHELAIGYYHDCIALASKLNRPKSIASKYHNLGGIYADENEFERALEYYDKAKQLLAGENEDDDLMSSIYQGMHLTYLGMEMHGEAFQNLLFQHQYALKSGIPKTIAFAIQGYAIHYLETKKYDSCIFYAKQTLDLANQLNNAQLTVNAYGYLKQAYYAKGAYKNAYDFFALEKSMLDSVYNLANSRLVESIKTEYDLEKKEREIAEKNLQIQTADFEIARQNHWQIAMFVVLCLLLILAVLIYRGYLLRKNANALLIEKNNEIQVHSAQIQKLNETKNRWFVNVAHELRTPLTLIKGPVERILRHERLAPSVENDLIIVERNTKNLVKLVNEILDLSKLEEGELALNREVLDLNLLLIQLLDIYDFKAKEQGIDLTFDGINPLYVNIDGAKLTSVISNLVTNALRHTSNGGRININVEQSDGLVISVADTGTGISEIDLPYVFDRFYQAVNKKNAGGTGVGLALSKEITELHGGELRVRSEWGKGSTFYVVLPSVVVVSEAVLEEFYPIEESQEVLLENIFSRMNEKPTLLLVEDNADMRKYVSGLLQMYFHIVEAKNGIEGLELLKAQEISLIISDIMMPEMDGLSFSKNVKANEEWRTIPFIYLSAISDQYSKNQALVIGVDDYLQKPFDREELIIRVQNLYRNALSRKEVNLEPEEPVSFEDRLLKKLKEEVEAKISDYNFNVNRLADCAAMSERQIYRYIKQTTGLTPLQFIQEIKLNKAMELVQKKVYTSSSEVASAVGFQQSPYFSSLFEKRFGKKPSAYLKAS